MNQLSTEEFLKKFWRTDELELIAKYEAFDKPNRLWVGRINNPIVNDRQVFYRRDKNTDYSKDVTVKVPASESLIDGGYYRIRVRPVRPNTTSNPYLVELDSIINIEENYQPPQEFIQSWFVEKGESPGDASTIASQLSLNDVNLYTHTERFIFELIQNADDMPDGSKSVSIDIELLNDHLLFMHNGCFFTRNDVQAIADAAKSTKTNDNTKTGYKGIGFKSVFSDSKRVYIFSAAYNFRFDKEYELYKDFWKLYEHYFSRNPEKVARFIGKEDEYTRIDYIPWQIKPIWTTFWQLPDEVKKRWEGKNYPVQIALEVGKENILNKKKVGYHKLITELLREPRFLLFLNNTNSINYARINEDLEREEHHLYIEEKELTEVWHNKVIVDTYIKFGFDFSLNNSDFLEAEMTFRKKEVEPGIFEFINNDGSKITDIPAKLIKRDKSRLTFASKIVSSNIVPLTGSQSILFNYLPTSDSRFGFPFLINADFITTTNREFIIQDNQWNQYLFYKIGYLSLNWLKQLAHTYTGSYLDLLVPQLLSSDNDKPEDINEAFNKGLLKGIAEIDFIATEYFGVNWFFATFGESG